MKTRFWIIFAIAAAVVVGGLTAVGGATPAENPGGPSSGLRNPLWVRVKERLELSDDQVAQIKKAIAPDAAALREAAHRLRATRVALRTVVQQPGASEEEIRQAAAVVGEAGADLAVLRARAFARVRPILSAEQMQKLVRGQARLDDRIDGAIDRFFDRLTE